jgi:co-chaperonin GroES (HSP10)
MNTIEFDKKVKCGPEFVALRIIDNGEQLKVGNIWMLDSSDANGRLAHCVIEDCGETAAKEYGLKAGDYVMIDRLSTFAHTAPVCVTRYNNVICLTDEKKTSFAPLRGMVFVEPDQKEEISNVGGVYVRDYDEKLNLGTVTDMNVEDEGYPFKAGDRVMVTKGADAVEVGDRTLFIYKKDMLICKIIEEENKK